MTNAAVVGRSTPVRIGASVLAVLGIAALVVPDFRTAAFACTAFFAVVAAVLASRRERHAPARPSYRPGDGTGSGQMTRGDTNLLAARDYFENILNALACPVLVKDRQHRFVLLNDAACEFFGHRREDLIGKDDYDIVSREEADVFRAKDELVFTSRRDNLNEETITDAKGNRFTIVTRKAVFKDASGADVLVAIINDITKLKESEERHRHLSQHDYLTGLPNRMLFEDRVRQVVLRGDRVGNRAAVMMLDLDRFKTANDSFGHAVGDQLLKLAGERIATCVRRMDTISRFGGDEFAVLLPDVASRDDAASVAAKILQAISRPFVIEGHEIGIGTSIGISLYPLDAADHASLIRAADQALYAVKAAGRNSFAFHRADGGTT